MFDTHASAVARLSGIRPFRLGGRVESVGALSVEISGLSRHVAVGDRVELVLRDGTLGLAEIVGVSGRCLQAAPFGGTLGIGAGAAVIVSSAGDLAPSDAWLGRVIDPLGSAVDGGCGFAAWPRETECPFAAAAGHRARAAGGAD